MNILWISPTPSHPQNAGNRAHIHALGKRILAAGHKVTFLLYDQEGNGSPPDAIEAMRGFWPEFFVIPHLDRSREKSQGDVWGIDDWFNKDINSAINFLAAQKNYDVVICEYVFFSKALTIFKNSTLKILNCHDRMSNRAELLCRNGLSPDFFYTTQEQEKIALDRADLILAIQHDEKIFFQELTSKCVIELGHPIEEKILSTAKLENNFLRIGYIGSGNSLNKKSLENLISALQCRPFLSQRIKLILAGTICNSVKFPNIERMGFVENEVDFFREIDVFINPMIDGTGLKIKTISALQYGVPIVATAAASAGVPTKDPAHTCESIDSLLDYLERLAASPENHLKELRTATLSTLKKYQDRIHQQFSDLLLSISTKSLSHLRRKKVLLVTDIPFWEPGVGNQSRILELCKGLTKEFDLKIFFYGSIWPDREKAIKNSGMSDLVISYKEYEHAAQDIPFATETPNLPGLKRARSNSFGKSLSLFLRKQSKYDVIIFEYIWLAYLRDAVPYPTFCILDTHDLMAPREYRFAHQGLQTGISITLKDEASILERFDTIIAIQSEEAQKIQSILPEKLVLCCPHGVEVVISSTPEISSEKQKEQKLRLGFVGGGSNENAAAIQWFIREVWPIVCKIPVEINIYGRVCEKVKDHSKKSGIILHGLKPSLDSAYAYCDVMINPIMHGGGLKIKSVEALAHGKPLISSPEGVVGIANPEKSGIIVAQNRADFIDAILRLAYFPDERREMATQALAAAKKQFSPTASFASLIALVRSV